jgi:hypothetical protein
MNRRYKLVATLIACCVISTSAQVLQRDSLMGVWVCTEATVMKEVNMPKEELAAATQFKAIVTSSKFLFKNNGLFEWILPANAPPQFKELDFLNNQKWLIDDKNKLVHIGPPNENLMQIMVKQEKGITYFILSDTPLLLRVKKQLPVDVGQN